ncbi:MAG: carbohydrate binding family 9 domain-containing protein, partial [Eudoraea sp.]|nr:carbohydrate binding family 9 domain-containing protein [Eudoraea sp.]
MIKNLTCLFLLLTSLAFYGQVGMKSSIYHGQNTTRSFVIKKIDNVIIPDGILNEPVWETANSAENFWQYFPLDSVQAKQQTEIKMLYDDKNLYIGIVVYALGKDYAIQSLKRDYRAGNSDNISLLFDTFSDSNNAFLFGINPYGVRREGLVSGGGQDFRSFTTTWDVKWRGDSKIYETYYTSEMVIPLTSFKFKEGETKWRFNSYRFDKQSNETSSWVNIPQNQNVWGLAFMGEMIFEKPLGKSKTPLALIPYINGSALKDFEEDNTTNKLSVGGDAKVAIGSSMNLDITVNPDFSQVEVDDQVTNLTRFEISLPEKRQFFIDNNDLFGSFGDQRDANPFFSRRIGIAKDTADNTIENRIIGGIRLSGKVNKDLRLGFLNLQTASDEENEIPSNNNMMLALQQKVFSRSNIGFFFINRQSLRDYDFILPEDEYNRVLGIEYNLISRDNVWNGKYFFQKSFQPESNGTELATGARLEYNSRNYNISGKLIYIDEDFRSDLGFVRRTDILKSFVQFERVFWPRNSFIQNHAFQIFPIALWSPSMDLKNTDYDLRGQWEARFRDQSRFSVEFSNKYTFLIDEFDPTGTDGGIPLPGNQGYHYNSIKAEYNSDRRKIFAYGLEPS